MKHEHYFCTDFLNIQRLKIGGIFLKIVTSSLQIFTCIYLGELKIFCIFADSKFSEGLRDLNIFVHHKHSKDNQIQWDNNKFSKKKKTIVKIVQ